MVLSTPEVAVKTTPTVISRFFGHYLNKQKKGIKGTARGEQLSYDEALAIIRQFLKVASGKTVEDLQEFTQNRVPTPTWVKTETVTIPKKTMEAASKILIEHLSVDNGIEEVGGTKWWQVRGSDLKGEFIEMAKDSLLRQKKADEAKAAGREPEPDRVLLYIHGGAYFFSSIETHRYQIQRHARKFNARAFAPSYRLAPQYPFPCGLVDALASYLYLIKPPKGREAIRPDRIVLAGDSAGAGMALALLVILRDNNLPLPAGACLISPWVDLSHSFPSVVGDSTADYIPDEGFHYKPSASWPPIPGDGVTIEIDGAEVELNDQVQMYCSNRLMSHPLVSPINQGSLGGLPPLMIMGGSSEILRDEMTYLAHKAANPERFAPSDEILDKYPRQRENLEKYPPTKVHLQMFDSCCHVTPTLAFTRPAKYMYRAAASFNLWAVKVAEKRAERKEEEPSRTYGDSESSKTTQKHHNFSRKHLSASFASLTHADLTKEDMQAANDDPLPDEDAFDSDSEGSSDDSSSDEDLQGFNGPSSKGYKKSLRNQDVVAVTGIEPEFVDSMIRERVSTSGHIRPMEPESEIEALMMPRKLVGVISQRGPAKKWLAKRAEWDNKFNKELMELRQNKIEDRKLAEAEGFLTRDLLGERPPLTAMAAWHNSYKARLCAIAQDGVQDKASSAVSFWARMARQADEDVAGKKQVEHLARKLSED